MKQNKKINRRDAMKVLGAVAGATVLANLPSKWSTPSIARGVLPAHAQTSACYAVYIEVLDTVGAGVLPSVITGPDPDEIVPNSFVFWNCQSGCLQFVIGLNGPGTTSAALRITTLTNQFLLDLENPGNTHDHILINMGSGAYALNFEGTVAGCPWTD